MKLLIESDLGHDCDDLFAIAWLAAKGCDIKAISLVPGSNYQVSLARLLMERCDFECPVGIAKKTDKNNSSNFYEKLFKTYGRPDGEPDGDGTTVLLNAMSENPGADVFVIGPCTSLGKVCGEFPDQSTRHAMMQGGFLPYHYHDIICPHLPQFEGKDWMGTFNLNGDRKGADRFIAAQFRSRRWVGKNVCHTIMLNKERYEKRGAAPNHAASFYFHACKFYLEDHSEKKFHDPTAACLMMNPEIGQWINGRPIRMGGGWGTELGGYDEVLAAVDEEELWKRLMFEVL